MEERRKWKNINTDQGRKKYKSLNDQLQTVTGCSMGELVD